MKARKIRIVKVEWRDAHTIMKADCTLEEIKYQRGLTKEVTIGCLVDENKERIAVCPTICIAEEPKEISKIFFVDGYRDVHFIPKNWIEKITELKEVKKR